MSHLAEPRINLLYEGRIGSADLDKYSMSPYELWLRSFKSFQNGSTIC